MHDVDAQFDSDASRRTKDAIARAARRRVPSSCGNDIFGREAGDGRGRKNESAIARASYKERTRRVAQPWRNP